MMKKTSKKVLELACRKVADLWPVPPFVFDPSFHKPAHFPSQDTNWVPGCRWQTTVWSDPRCGSPAGKTLRVEGAQTRRVEECGVKETAGEVLGLKFINAGTVKRPKIKLEIYSKEKLTSAFVESLVDEINYRYDLQADLSDFAKKFKNDKQLGPILKKWPGMRIMSPQSLYEYLIIGIVLQNCTVRRSVSMMQTLFENYGTPVRFGGKDFYCFWEPKVLAAVSEDELRALKVGYRAKSLKRISKQFSRPDGKTLAGKTLRVKNPKPEGLGNAGVKEEGPIDELDLRTKSRDEQREALISLYGIGPATVGYILFDVFKHYDELEHISPWEQKIYSKLFFDRDPSNPVPEKKLLKFFSRRFGKYKMLAVNYIWEDLFWQRKHGVKYPWLEELIRL